MRRRSNAAGGVIECSRLRARGGRKGLGRPDILRRSDDQHIGEIRQRGDRREVGNGIIGQVGVDSGRDGVPVGMDEDRVAVGGRLRGDVDAKRSPGTGPVLDENRLSQLRRELLGERAGKNVRRAAGADGRNDADRF